MGSERVAIRRLEASDAESLVGCFRRCYEGTYPADAFEDPAHVAALVRDGRLRSVVAVAPGDGVVGHMGLTLRAQGALAAEAGNTVVDPSYRGQHLAARLAVELSKLALETGLVGFAHYPTTAHPVMQQLAVRAAGVEVGLLFDYIPADTRYVGFEESSRPGRVAVVAVYEPLAAAPVRRVWVPTRHRALAESLYAGAGLERAFAAPDAGLPAASAKLRARFEERRELLRIEIDALGGDLGELVAAHARPRAGVPVLVDLPLSDPAADAATEVLSDAGFFFGALLPEYTAAGDVLRLQRTAGELTAPKLATPGGRELFAYTSADGSVERQ